MCRVRTVTGLGQAKGHPELALQSQWDKLLFLLLTAEAHKHNNIWEVAHHGVLGL
jgi:hypothetical protein